jgi:tetratricopeptide (TPR) repeat protein
MSENPTRAHDPDGLPAPNLTTATASSANLATISGCDGSVTRQGPSVTTGRYELRGEIARGGMGVIYRAYDCILGREVALKVLREKYGPASAAARRFADEAHITAQLQHPAIPPVHDQGSLPDGRPFLAMKLIKGETLNEQLADRSDPGSGRGRFLATFENICQALAYAHDRHVIHRDLKPANVMVGSFGEVQVMDWGLAKVLNQRPSGATDPDETHGGTEIRSTRDSDGSETHAGSVLGTPAYMPPEQAVGAIGKVDKRSDVFGLGAILAVILTGHPPYAGNSEETTRVLAATGKVDECFIRLDECGADPELVTLCKRCLAPDTAGRPADASQVAAAVANLRAIADERARQAELDRVKAEGEKIAAELKADEQRKRRRVQLGAAAVLGMVVVCGLGAVLAVQRQANMELAKKNTELAEEQAKVQTRFDLAQKSIATFHTGVSEDALLQNDEFKELRDKLLKQAVEFYGDLEKLLEGQTDARSRKALAAAYFQVGELTEKLGLLPEALAVHRKALSLRRDLAAEAGADEETRLDVARSLRMLGRLLSDMNDGDGAMAAHDEARRLAEKLAGESGPGDAVELVLAQSHFNIALLLSETEKLDQALEVHRKALAIRQKLADANPDAAPIWSDLARSNFSIGAILVQTKGKPEEVLEGHWKTAFAIQEKLVRNHPKVLQYQSDLAKSHFSIGSVLLQTKGRPEEVLEGHWKAALAIQQQLVEDYPAVTHFQSEVAHTHDSIGVLLAQTGNSATALVSYRKALAIKQKLTDANPSIAQFRSELARTHNSIGLLLSQTGNLAAAQASLENARTIQQKLANDNSKVPQYQSELASIFHNIGSLLIQLEKPADVLSAFRKAMEIQQNLADANPAINLYQSELARSHQSIGVLLTQTGHLEEALSSFTKARDIQDKLAAAHRNVIQYQTDLALTLYHLGALQVQMRKSANALLVFETARQAQKKLTDAYPAVLQFRSDLALTYNGIGVLQAQMGKPEEALDAYRTALSIQMKLAATNPAINSYQTELARTHNNIGKLLVEKGSLGDALASFEKARHILEKQAFAPSAQSQSRIALGRTQFSIAWVLSQLGKSEEALDAYRTALSVLQKVADENPTNPERQAELADSLLAVGFMLAKAGKNEEAANYYTREESVRRGLVKQLDLPDARDSLANCQTNLADVLRKSGRLEKAKEACARALTLRESLVKANSRSTTYRGGLAETNLRAGQIKGDENDPAGAATCIRGAVAIYEELSDLSGEQMLLRAGCHACLSELAIRPGSGVSKEETRTESDRGMDWLRKATAAGYTDHEVFRTESSLDSLRGRNDFQKLMTDLEAKTRKPVNVAPPPRAREISPNPG